MNPKGAPDPVRVYVLVSAAGLRQLREGAELPPSPAYAVTPALRRLHPQDDEEGLEYLALRAAAADHDAVGRCVIAAADAPAAPSAHSGDSVGNKGRRGGLGRVTGPGDIESARVDLAEGVGLDRIASFHVAEHDGAIGAEDDLLWYDRTELGAVLDLAGG